MIKSKEVQKKVVLITGCSSGLGLELASQMSAKQMYKLVITCREKSIEKLTSRFTESDNLIVRKLDVTEDTQITELIDEICHLWGRIDVLINNAGICFRSVVEHMDIESEIVQLKTNYLGPMSIIRSVLPIMREQKSGHIINISSVSGMVSMPTMASYSASKHALEGATEALWYETKPYGINVTLLEPGFINSDSFKNVILSKKALLSSQLRGPHSEYYFSMSPFIENLMKLSFSKPHNVAIKALDLIEMKNPPLRCRATLDAKIFVLLKKIIPSNFFHKVMFMLLPGTHRWGRAKALSTRN
jgi:short-subunit dehydrogenase